MIHADGTPLTKYAHFSIRNQRGGALVIAMITVVMVGVMLVPATRLSTRILANQAAKVTQARSDVAQNMSNIVLFNDAISASVFDQTCLQNNVIGKETPTTVSGVGCLLDKVGTASVDAASPYPEDQDFVPFAITSPFDPSLKLSGTRADPACYNDKGVACVGSDTTCICAFRAFTMYKEIDIPTSFTGQGAGGGSIPKEKAIVVRSRVVPAADLRNVKATSYVQEAVLKLNEINQRGYADTTNGFPLCMENGAVKSGYMKVAVKPSSVGPNYEEDICVPAIGARPCPVDRYQVGVTAMGDPVCDGDRAPCPADSIPVGMRDMGTGNIVMQCMNAVCRNRPAADGVRRFGFVSPKATDTTAVTCMLIQPKAGKCENRVKTGVINTAELDCEGTKSCTLGDANCGSVDDVSLITSQPTDRRPACTYCDPTTGPTVPNSITTACAPGQCNTNVNTATGSSFDSCFAGEGKTAIAVRAPACIGCHANIQSNFLTDFGLGSPWGGSNYDPATYLNRATWAQSSGPPGGSAFDYRMHSDLIDLHDPQGGGLGSAQISGELRVPFALKATQINTPDSNYLNSIFPSMGGAIPATFTWDYYFNNLLGTRSCSCKTKDGLGNCTLYQCSISAVQGIPKFSVNYLSQVFISAPKSSDLSSAGASLGSGPDGIKYTATRKIKGTAYFTNAPTFSGITRVGDYYKNTGNIVCDGDAFINGDLLLANAKIDTKTGCRLYVTGHVFVSGPIVYVNTNPDRNLQIQSSSSVNFGLGKSCSPDPYGYKAYTSSATAQGAIQMRQFYNDFPDHTIMVRRMFEFDNFMRNVAESNSARDTFAAALVTVAQKMGTKDADCEPGITNRRVDYSRLMINAPYYGSRYIGNFTGVIVAEVPMPSIGNFRFNFDDVFSRVPVLPLICQNSYLICGNAKTCGSVVPGEY